MASSSLQKILEAAMARLQNGTWHHASRLACHALALSPANPEALHTAGVAACHMTDYGLAARRLERAVRIEPGSAFLQADLGNIYQNQRRLGEAEDVFRRAVALDPYQPAFRYNLGNCLKLQGRLQSAAISLQTAILLSPHHANALNNLSNIYLVSGRSDLAECHYRRALNLNWDFPGPLNNLGNIFKERAQFVRAAYCYLIALIHFPAYADAWGNLGAVLQEQGLVDRSIAATWRAVHINFQDYKTLGNLIMGHLYLPEVRLPDILQLARRWQISYGHRPTAQPLSARRNQPPRRPRIGVLSGDFRQHAVGVLLIPAIEGLARNGYEIICYNNYSQPDPLTARFRAAARAWREVWGLSDSAVLAMIRREGIDLLIDAAGFTAQGRLPVFAERAAPVQVAWAGYPGTTGIDSMDYIIADWHQLPAGAEAFFTEKPLRLPFSYIGYEPPAGSPLDPALPARENGFVTFASFNMAKKISSLTIQLWSRILATVPGSKLLLKAVAFGCEETCDYFRRSFAENGVGGDRLVFAGPTSPAEHRLAMGRADICLDSFPYSGGLTTLECLWMGLPVITLPGDSFASRHSSGYLITLGLEDLVAKTPEDYVKRATALASAPSRLAELRNGLRQRMLSSPLCDLPGFSRYLGVGLTAIWQRHCQGKAPAATWVTSAGLVDVEDEARRLQD